mmetsp:Transcript_126717/g.354775  ORF Transcript_126717/g.354775 Transcript_126717/m.354775 type:complete len:224 (+) Transcript_126717:133-804(+)
MRLYNADVEEAERPEAPSLDHEADCAEVGKPSETFFELRQRTLAGMDQQPAFRLVALGVVRKLRANLRGSVLHSEIQDALGRYFRVLDSDMQRFASLYETVDAAKRSAPSGAALRGEAKRAIEASNAILQEVLVDIAAVLLACGQKQEEALALKQTTQVSVAECQEGSQALVSFSRVADLLDDALALCDLLRRKREEVHQQRMGAMAAAIEARARSSCASPGR